MSEHDVVRAWKDRRYRRSLSAGQRERLPESPAGAVELSEERLAETAGVGLPDAFTLISGCVCTWYMGCGRTQNDAIN